MLRRRLRSLTAAHRPVLAMLALAGFLAGTIGVPLPRSVVLHKDRSQPFPCMDRACGCQSAAQCWRGCCCFSHSQKLAWAKAKGVAAPAFVTTAARLETKLAAKVSCCETPAAASCCSPKPAACEVETEPAPALEFVLAIQTRQCQGQAELWLALGTAAPLPRVTEFDCRPAATGDAIVAPPLLTSVSLSPATPPPRA